MRVDEFKSLVSQKGGMARANQYEVILPRINNVDPFDLNILCKEARLPGRQMTTSERTIGLHQQKVGYGYAVTDVNMVFHVLNDYGARKYFEAWQSLVVNPNTYDVGYLNTYAKSVKVWQLTNGKRVFGIELMKAYPTTLDGITLNNEADGIVELNVTFSYKNWRLL